MENNEANKFVEQNSIGRVAIPLPVSIFALYVYALTKGPGMIGLLVFFVFVALAILNGAQVNAELLKSASVISLGVATAFSALSIMRLVGDGVADTYMSLLIQQNGLVRNIVKPFSKPIE